MAKKFLRETEDEPSAKLSRARKAMGASTWKRSLLCAIKLRKHFKIYPETLEASVKFANELEQTHMELLRRIQVERQRNH